MSLNGKRDNFERADLITFARAAGLKTTRASNMLAEVIQAVDNWPSFADSAGVPKTDQIRIESTHRLELRS